MGCSDFLVTETTQILEDAYLRVDVQTWRRDRIKMNWGIKIIYLIMIIYLYKIWDIKQYFFLDKHSVQLYNSTEASPFSFFFHIKFVINLLHHLCKKIKNFTTNHKKICNISWFIIFWNNWNTYAWCFHFTNAFIVLLSLSIPANVV